MLVLDHVRRSFGNVAAVRDIGFSVAKATVLGLLGPNGAGKTTTMRMILGIYPPDSGTITWMTRPLDAALRRRFGYIPEERGLYAQMRVREQIVYFGRLHGLEVAGAQARADYWLRALGIEAYARRASGELSKGNQQKVQMACAVVHDPDVLVLDEPFAGLDPVNAEAMVQAIRLLAGRGAALVLSSHQMWQIENVCDAFCIIGAGLVRARGTLAELRAQYPTRIVRVSPDTAEIQATFERFGASRGPSTDGAASYTVAANADFGALLRAAVAAGPVTSFDRAEPSLNDIYLRAIERPPEPLAA